MGLAYVVSVVGALMAILGAFMLVPLGVCLLYGEKAWLAFLVGALLSILGGGALYWLFRDSTPREINHRQGMAIVALAWLLGSVLGAVPFYLSGDFKTFIDCVFETASGFTTTGASVLTDVEAAGRGVLFWRALTHWLGGMGFVVLSLAVLPFVGLGGMQLYKAEVPSPTVDRLRPRIMDTAAAMWKIYAGLTALQIVLLLLGGMDWFDSTCHAFATLATGGFSTKNASVAHFHSAYLEWVIAIFMWLAGMNFSLFFLFLARRGDPRVFWRDDEWRFYTGVFVFVTLGVALGLFCLAGKSAEESLRLAAFQVSTILTTTGFATDDYGLWPPLSVALIVVIMFIGGSAGSTGGGPKCMRVLIMLRRARVELTRMVHPHMVAAVRFNGHLVDRDTVGSIWAFLGLYIAIYVLCSLSLTAMGVELTEAFTGTIACLGNIGPGLGGVGPVGNYAAIPPLGKLILSAAMIIGRLEIYTVLVLILPEFWRR